MAEPVYRRVVIKLSGEYLAGSQSFGIDQPTIDRIAGDLIAAQKLGIEVAVVIGGGNIVRGVEVSARGVSRPTGDTMGMLATMMNCLALEAAIERKGTPARTLSAFVMPEISELFTRSAAHKYLSEGRIVLLGGGTGCIGINQLPAALGRLVLHALGLRQTPWVIAFGLGKANLVGIFLRELRQCSIGRAHHKCASGSTQKANSFATCKRFH